MISKAVLTLYSVAILAPLWEPLAACIRCLQGPRDHLEHHRASLKFRTTKMSSGRLIISSKPVTVIMLSPSDFRRAAHPALHATGRGDQDRGM